MRRSERLIWVWRIWEDPDGLRMVLDIWRLQATPGWSGSGRFGEDPRELGRIMEGLSSLEFGFQNLFDVHTSIQ